MVDLDWKAKMVSSDIPTNKSSKLSNKLSVSMPFSFRIGQAEILTTSSTTCSAYEYYLRLPELRKQWSSKKFTPSLLVGVGEEDADWVSKT
ncbi:hypothetical protein FNV43_RR13417 [Rhamnella rubrinervis]|uniref:Nematode resistance protein-like HSPRO1 N-terminal domain-containing protein n=1 Tax=Rhamnella rubrinervis TaxID=2594499 RepID=A0A8K0H125_9ROSA|nr:hypothetical protein FNV43_RR13417 [Rhamnella rubrinervis]